MVFNQVTVSKYSILNDFSLQNTITEEGDNVLVARHDVGNELLNTFDDRVDTKVELPMHFDVGISFSKADKYLWGVQYEQKDWTGFNHNNPDDVLGLARKATFGGEFVPNINAGGYGKFWRTMNYKLGVYAGEAPYSINNSTIYEYGMNIGFSTPLSRRSFATERFGSYINIGLGYGYRGAVNVTHEHIFHLNLAIVLNDKWFIKRKFN